ncbi:metalloendopeptidase [Microbotryomycetes sp. JL221]|nr:metalloendopeptidase [Microbotryomycetes sp. JL221]
MTSLTTTRQRQSAWQQHQSIHTTTLHLQQYRRFGDPPPSHSAPTARSSVRRVESNSLLTMLSRFNQQQQQQRGGGGRGPLSRFRKPPAIVLVVVVGGGIYYVLHLERVEHTGRLRFMDVSQQTEQQMGLQAFQQTMGEFQHQLLPDRHPTSRYVQSVVERIIEANELKSGSNGWQIHVVKDDKTRNAFVLPGGKIFVFSGILPIAQDEDGLAVILGHEIAHQVARHSAERMSSLKVLFGLSLLLESIGLDAGLSRMLLNLVMTLPNSRKSESEADLIGLKLANQACFDVTAARGLWQRMNKAEGAGGANVDFLSTHPSSSKRVDKVTEWAQEIVRDRPAACGPLERQADAFKSFASSNNWR